MASLANRTPAAPLIVMARTGDESNDPAPRAAVMAAAKMTDFRIVFHPFPSIEARACLRSMGVAMTT
jgi:hypothetical protein